MKFPKHHSSHYKKQQTIDHIINHPDSNLMLIAGDVKANDGQKQFIASTIDWIIETVENNKDVSLYEAIETKHKVSLFIDSDI